MNKRSEIRYFAQDDLWKRSAVSEQLAVAEDLIELVPDSVKTILDAGCGNGTVTNQLMSRWDVVGCDISEAAVKHVQAPALVADLCAIPFADGCFDLTLSSDVIEHLPDAIYAQALAEIARVSGRYILVAVPYRELLEAAEVTCPGCGLGYHAHLHQRSYTVADAVSLFEPAFTAVDVRFSGESWTFEAPELLHTSRMLSGLDYPFEDGVCPHCSTRRGAVEQSSSALMVQRRFEALQAMQVAEGVRDMPDNSEILVLFERGASLKKNWASPASVAPFSDSTLQLASLVLRDDPTNYPREPYRLKGDADYGLVTIPRRPQSVQVTAGHLEALEVYDHVRKRYAACPSGERAGSFLPAVTPFGPHGCILRMLRPSDDLQLQLNFADTDVSTITACCLGDDPAITQVREESSKLSTLANELERKRAEVEDSFTQLSARAASLETLISAKELRIDELLHENQQVCSQRAVDNLQIEELALKWDQMNTLANVLEQRREALEEQLQLREQQLGELQARYDHAQSSNEHLIEKACALELKQHVFASAIKSLESQVTHAQIIMLEHLGAAEHIDALELEKNTLCLELESLNMEVSERSTESTKPHQAGAYLDELSRRLESQREALEGKVKSLDWSINSLMDEKIEYQCLVDALHIRLGHRPRSDADYPGKVLVLSHMYPRDYNQAGGIFVHEQVKALRALGIDARVVSGEPFWVNTLNPRSIKRAWDSYRSQNVSKWEDHDGVPLIRFPYIVSALLPFQAHATTYTHGLLRQAAWLHADFPFELVHAHTAYTDGTAGRCLSRKFKVPLVITEHTGPFTTLTRTGYLRRMTKKALNAADQVIAVSSALLSDIRQQVKLSPDVSAQVIGNLVDTEWFNEQPRPSDELIHLLWVGHFVPVKRVPVLLEAFAAAVKVQPQLRLRLVGTGEGQEQAKALVKSLGIEQKVEFSGQANRAQLVDHYQHCDFLVISSESETFCVVAIEAMSCGRPVLTTCCGGPAEIVSHPQLGQVVGMSVEALTEGMLSMALQRAQFSSKVIRKTTELKFSGSSIAQEIAAVYSASIAKSRG